MSRKAKLVSFLSAVVLLAGCAVVSSHEEYSAYRSVRRAENDRDRLIAAQQYAEHHPGGNFIDEVQGIRRQHEDQVWASSSDSREGLEWYMRVYPDGQYVEQARPRLAALQTVSQGRQQEEAARDELEEQRRQAAIEARRTWVTRAMQFWTRTLTGIRNYGSSIQRVVGANEDFSRAFGQAPDPQCTADYCIKHYGQVYHIPVPGATRIDRSIDVYLRLVFVRGRMDRAELVLPNKGFSRWYEMENRTVVTDEDPEQRQTAINWALDRIQPVIEEVAQGATRIDFVPEGLTPLQVHGQSSDAAPDSPDEAAPAPAPAAQKQDDIDDLLGGAIGGEEATPEPTPPAEVTPEPAETMVLPIGLISWQFRNLRVVIFAASPDDYEQGYDGLFIERIRD